MHRPHAYSQLPDIYVQIIPHLCNGAENQEEDLYALDGNPKMVEKTVNKMQYFQHSKQSRSSKLKR